jgi:hypothetical protein
MSAADIVAPMCRLDALSRGLSLELHNVSKADVQLDEPEQVARLILTMPSPGSK